MFTKTFSTTVQTVQAIVQHWNSEYGATQQSKQVLIVCPEANVAEQWVNTFLTWTVNVAWHLCVKSEVTNSYYFTLCVFFLICVAANFTSQLASTVYGCGDYLLST